MELKKAFILTIVLAIIGLAAWELYWRSQGFYPTLNDEKALWAWQRAKVEKATKDNVIMLGSSRTYFDIQLKEWEEETGKPPIQLAIQGSSPLPTFHDIVNHTNFNGTIIIGVTPGLFFSTTSPGASPWKNAQSKVDFYKSITYAQRLNFLLSIPLQENLVLMSSDDEDWADNKNLKSLIKVIQVGNRTGAPDKPPFYNFSDVTISRNLSMTERTSSDTAFANTIIRVWQFFSKDAKPPKKDATTAFFMEDVKKFKEKEGNILLVRYPSSGSVRDRENHGVPRANFWDDLVKQTKSKAYHFEDYEQFKNLKCPEESHLSAKDARYFTSELARIMIKDGALINL
jgi:hypothetical protein